MKFGKEFKTHLEETLPEWRDKFLCYKPLKKLLKQLPPTVDSLNLDRPVNFQLHPHPPPLTGDVHGNTNRPLVDLQEWFVRILNEELDKFNDFYVDKEEDFVIRLQELKERIESLKEKSSKDGVFTSESEFSEEMMDIRKDLVTIHGEMVLLKNYSSLNFADQSNPSLNNTTSISPGPPTTLGEETIDIYRSTLAAMKAIRGLQKASSTSNPLSFSSFFKIQDDESTGAVTAANSTSNSSATMHDGEEIDQEDVHSV
ncbi:SPX domain-containing protein 4 [Populus alba x Populus x berolinensis]|uniref:SPX domain-containing protein 4 n=1 Tax=Populus alba x Populus x berolinensis TaxID=444605 RepID=A0AAD6PTT9_9ROSI|nr:SPX domain-containing protein 4 [Populus alba x Populus x berolinensis]